MFPTIHGVLSQGLDGPQPDPPEVRGGPSWYGVTAWTELAASEQLGARFTVGNNDLVVTHLCLYVPSGSATEVVRLWRVFDEVLIAQAEITATDGTGEVEITPLTLLAGQQYIISHRRADGASRIVRRASSIAQLIVDPGITYESGASAGNSNGFPGSISSSYVSASFRTAPQPGKYRFYRLMLDSNNGDPSFAGTSSLEFAQSPGGLDLVQTEGGKAYAAHNASGAAGTPAGAFDGNTRTGWAADPGRLPEFVQIDFGSGREPEGITHYRVGSFFVANTNGPRSPRDWRIQASYDMEHWTTLHTVTGESGWVVDEVREYSL